MLKFRVVSIMIYVGCGYEYHLYSRGRDARATGDGKPCSRDPPCPEPSPVQQHRALHTRSLRPSTATQQHTASRVKVENRAPPVLALAPGSKDDRRAPPPPPRQARLVRGVRGLHIPAPMLLLNSQLHAHLLDARAAGPLTHTHEHARHGASPSGHNLVTISMVQERCTPKGARPSRRSPVMALVCRPWPRIQAPVPSASLGLIRPH